MPIKFYQLNERSRIKLVCPQVLQHEFIMLNSYQAIKVNGEMHVNITRMYLKTASRDRVGPPLVEYTEDSVVRFKYR